MLGLWVASFSGVSVSGLLRHGAPTKWAQVQGKRLALPHTPRAPHSLSDDMFMRPGGEAMSLMCGVNKVISPGRIWSPRRCSWWDGGVCMWWDGACDGHGRHGLES